MSSPSEWLGQLVPWLRTQARMLHLDPRLRTRFGSSDLVQETLLKAHKNIAQCRATSPAEMLGWLRQILRNQLRDMVEREHAQKCDVSREQPLNALLTESSDRLDAILAAVGPSPDEQVEHQLYLIRLTAVLDAALEQLPEAQRDAIILQKLQGLPIEEIAHRLGRTVRAVKSLIDRAKLRLFEMPELRPLLDEQA